MLYTYIVTVINAVHDWQNKDYQIDAKSSMDAINLVRRKYRIKGSQSGTEYSTIKL